MKRLRTFFTSLLISLLAGYAGPGWTGDDIDIYVRQASSLNESVRPNILFMLDNSGSMKNAIRDEQTGVPYSERRIDVLQAALLQMLNEVHNVNVGLARFAKLIKGNVPVNAPIMFPVFYIDADLTEVPGESNDSVVDVSSRLASSADDAEENLVSGNMYLNNKDLKMVKLVSAGDFKGIEVKQYIDATGKNAALEWLGNVRNIPTLGNNDRGQVKVSQSTLLLGSDSDVAAKNRGDALIALRFTNLSIPVGAKIEKAEVEFVSDNTYRYEKETDKLKLTIYGAANDGAPTDKSGLDIPKDVSGYLSKQENFPSTNTTVDWSIDDDVEEGQAFKTPDISSVLQEIIKRGPQTDEAGNLTQPGWGEGNSIVLLFKSAADSPSNARGFFSKKELYDTPLLHLSWTVAETTAQVISGRGVWNNRTQEYKVENNEQAIEYDAKQTTNGMYLGYVPAAAAKDTVALQAAVKAATSAYTKAQTATNTAQSKLSTADTNLQTATTNYNLAKADYDAEVAKLDTQNQAFKEAEQAFKAAEVAYQTALEAFNVADKEYVDAKADYEATKLTVDSAKTALAEAQAVVEAARIEYNAANDAYKIAAAAYTTASANYQTANQAFSAARSTFNTANSAYDKAVKAQTTYETAKAKYDTAAAKVPAPSNLASLKKDMDDKKAIMDAQPVAPAQQAKDTAQAALNEKQAFLDAATTAKNDALVAKDAADAERTAKKAVVDEAMVVQNEKKALLTDAQTVLAGKKTVMDTKKDVRDTKNTEMKTAKTDMTDKERKMNILMPKSATLDRLKVKMDSAKAKMDTAQATKDTAEKTLEDAQKAEEAAEKALETAKKALEGGKGMVIKGTKSAVGVRFQELPIPKNATIIEAYITFTHQGNDQADYQNPSQLDLNLNVYGEKTGNALDLASANPWLSKRVKTKASVEWTSVSPSTPGTTFRTPAKQATNPPAGTPDPAGTTDPSTGGTTDPSTGGTTDPSTGTTDQSVQTTDLSAILQELVTQDDWKSRNSVVFMFENANTEDFTGKLAPEIGGFRRFIGVKDDLADDTKGIAVADLKGFANLPRLTVKYSAGIGAGDGSNGTVGDGDEQLVGLRFVDVDIPQGAKVLSATIDFKSNGQTADPAILSVNVEDSDAAETFTNTPKNLSSRSLSSTPVPWEVEPWEKGATYTSPDLTTLVQTVVNRSGWCGGKGGIVFIISKGEGMPLRITKSYDDAPVLAPVLNVEYDMKSVPKGSCIQQTYSGQIAFESDDSEEKVSGAEAGDIYLTSDSLELGFKEDSRLVGFRFRDVPISKTSKVVEAKLVMTARTTNKETANTPPTDLTIRGEKIGDSEPFTSATGDLSGRKKTTEKTDWATPDMTAWQKNYTYTSPDISNVINEIVGQDDWNTYNNLSLFVTGTGFRAANAFRAGPATAAILRIKVDGYLGEGGQGDIMTVRRQLRKIVKNIDIPPSNTPLVDALYESAQYFRGGPVDYGKTRYNQPLYLVSHPGTYTGGTLTRPKECTTTKPFEAVCASEEISGVAKYTSPILTPCQSNHLVLLTDGLANQNASAESIQSMIKEFQPSCDLTYPDPDSAVAEGDSTSEEGPKTIKISKSEMCGIDLARFLHRNDNTTKVKDNQYVTTHTIGFQLGKGWTGVYKDGEGRPVVREDDIYYYATSEYGKTDEEVPPDKIATVQPAGYVEDEKATRQNADAVKYLKEIAKEGGGGFYNAKSVEDLVAAFKSIVSQAMTTSTMFAAAGVSLNRFNNLYHNREVYFSLFKPDRTPRWFGNVKQYHICQGVKSMDGVDCNAGELLDADKQKAYKDGYIAESSRSYWSAMPDGKEVALGGAGEHVPDAGTRNIFTYLDDDLARNVNLDDAKNEVTIDNEGLKPFLFGDEPADDFEKIVNWIRGQDVMDEDGDGDSQEPRWRIADPLHSSPVVVMYGGTTEQQQARLFVGTNDGLLRMLKADTGNPDPTIGGDEEWAFLPKDLLSKQVALMQNQAGDEHIYGLDSTPTLWTFDNNGNVQVDPEDGDFVKLYISMRRGGNNIYALDVTGSKEAPGSSPQLMWVIKGSIPETPFERLGQTWSRPLITQIQWKGKGTKVVLFGGGYHPSQDEGFGPTADKVGGGNAIFIADAMTGERLWWASSNERADLKLTGMTYAIPSEVLFKDTDADGNTDRIYAGDMGGQVWRVDLPIGLGTGQTAQGIQLATVSTDKPEERRRFFYPPEVIRLDDQLYAEGDGTKYDLVAIVSGTRTEPLEKVVHNQFYAFRDTQTGMLADDLSNWAGPITLDQMFDATANVIQEDDNNSKIVLELKKSRGWYINLQEKAGDDRTWIGEKGFSKVLIADQDNAEGTKKKTVFFNTYIPPAQSESVCDFSEGKNRTYIIDVFTAAAVVDVDKNKELTKSDRFVEGSGTASDSTPPIATADGTNRITDGKGNPATPDSDIPVTRFFWMQK